MKPLYDEAVNHAVRLASNLTCDAFDKIINWSHTDGSWGSWHYAYFEEYEDDWYIICTEHHGYFVYHKEDLIKVNIIN